MKMCSQSCQLVVLHPGQEVHGLWNSCDSLRVPGAPASRTACGIAGNTVSRHSAIAFTLPGKLMTRDFPQIPAVCLLRIAVGTCSTVAVRIRSPKPGSIFLQAFSVASGVTSRGAGPVPPVVRTRSHVDESLTMASVIESSSSGTIHVLRAGGPVKWLTTYLHTSGPPLSTYSPRDARSDTVKTPTQPVEISSFGDDIGSSCEKSTRFRSQDAGSRRASATAPVPRSYGRRRSGCTLRLWAVSWSY